MALLELQAQILDLKEAVNTGWIITTGSIIFLMQGGFALIEGGACRGKSVVSVLLKNFMDAALGALTWFLYGYAFAFGVGNNPNSFIGNDRFALVGAEEPEYAVWFFQYTFCATSATIVSGAVAERVPFTRYFAFSAFLTGFIYPVVAHAAWSKTGWLSPFNDGTLTTKVSPKGIGVMDFAGSGVIHMTGGIAAIIASKVIGPRTGRFNDDGTPREMKGHSITMATVGTIFLMFSWYSFNAGSTMQLTDNKAKVASRAVMTTTIAVATSTLTAVIVRFFQTAFNMWDINVGLNAALGGAVAITAGCAVVEPWGAFITGILAGAVYLGASYVLLHRLGIDDPVDAGAVHFANGFLGLLIPGLFASSSPVKLAYGITDDKYLGVFTGGDGTQLGYQLLFAVWVIGWVGFWSAAALLVMRRFVGVRVPVEDEHVGLDIAHHGGVGYDYLGMFDEVAEIETKLVATEKAIVRYKRRASRLRSDSAFSAGETSYASQSTL